MVVCMKPIENVCGNATLAFDQNQSGCYTSSSKYGVSCMNMYCKLHECTELMTAEINCVEGEIKKS